MLRAYPEEIIKENPEIRIQYIPQYIPYVENQSLDKLIILGIVAVVAIVCITLLQLKK